MNETTAQGFLSAAASLFDAFVWDRLFPLLVIVGCAIALYWLMAKGQRADPRFRAVDFMCEENGKASWKRLTGTGCFVVHSAVVYIASVKGTLTFEEQALYVLTWSGSVVLLEGIRIIKGAPAQPPQPPGGQQ